MIMLTFYSTRCRLLPSFLLPSTTNSSKFFIYVLNFTYNNSQIDHTSGYEDSRRTHQPPRHKTHNHQCAAGWQRMDSTRKETDQSPRHYHQRVAERQQMDTRKGTGDSRRESCYVFFFVLNFTYR
jgi:hypothetical protein